MIVENKYKITFEEDNPNILRIANAATGKIINMISLPPRKYGTDIIDLDEPTTLSGYKYNYKGLVVITNPRERIVYYKGREICKTNRIKPTITTKQMFEELLVDEKPANFTIIGDDVHYIDDKN